eukprot:4905717-Amphidinium_carterae.1
MTLAAQVDLDDEPMIHLCNDAAFPARSQLLGCALAGHLQHRQASGWGYEALWIPLALNLWIPPVLNPSILGNLTWVTM